MPNTPALVNAGITGLYAPSVVGVADREAAEKLVSAVGAALWFENESDLDVVVAVSGSGPAYVFYAMEAPSGPRRLGCRAGSVALASALDVRGAAKLRSSAGEDPGYCARRYFPGARRRRSRCSKRAT